MIIAFDKIVKEWGYRVKDGKPNPNNSTHLYHLTEILFEYKWPFQVIDELLQNLNEVAPTAMVPNPNPKGRADKVQYRYAQQWLDDNPDAEPSDDFKKDVGQEEPEDTEKGEEPRKKLRNRDIQSVNSALNYTKDKEKADRGKTGEKELGAGTHASRAGEAAVHHSLRTTLKMIKGGTNKEKALESMKSELIEITKQKGTFLKKDWVNSAINTTSFLIDNYGNDIDDVVWDTRSGRNLIDVEGHGTSSDMFLKLKDGRRLGVSLKKDTDVALLNGGYNKEHNELLKRLKKQGVSEEIIKKFDKIVNPDIHAKQIEDAAIESFSVLKGNPNLIKDIIKKYQDESLIEKDFDALKYKPFLQSMDLLIDTLPNEKEALSKLKEIYPEFSRDINRGQLYKFVHKVSKNEPIRNSLPELYDNARQSDIDQTTRLSDFFKENKEVENALRQTVMNGLHLKDMLFAKSEKLDGFITVYGTKPATQLSPDFLTKTFKISEKYESWKNEKDSKKKEELEKQILDEAFSSIVIDHKDGKKQGEIRIKDRDNEKDEGVHMFKFGIRSRALGAAPTLEMLQSTYMGNSIKQGTTDVTKWDEKTKKRWKTLRIKELNVNKKDATREEIEDINREIRSIEEL